MIWESLTRDNLAARHATRISLSLNQNGCKYKRVRPMAHQILLSIKPLFIHSQLIFSPIKNTTHSNRMECIYPLVDRLYHNSIAYQWLNLTP